MSRNLLFSLVVVAVCVQASEGQKPNSAPWLLCSDFWYRTIEEQVPTSDLHNHGPDAGSEEWKAVIEFKLGVRGEPDVPSRDSESWCWYIDQLVRGGRSRSSGDGNAAVAAMAPWPSYDCEKVRPDSIEAVICKDRGLSALDRQLSDVYAIASKKAANKHLPQLKAQQRGWIKGRNECWKSDDKGGCVRDGYIHRIAELQARYRLVPSNGPLRYVCGGNSGNEVIATFFQTVPPTLIAEYADSVSLMYLHSSGSGARYQGRNEIFWEHQGEALITWGYGASEMRCKKGL